MTRLGSWLTVASLGLGLGGCVGQPGSPGDEEPGGMANRGIEEVQEAFTPEWMDLPGVVGTGIGLCEGQPCIKVFVTGPIQELEEQIPNEVDGHRVVLEQTGRFQPRDTSSN